MGAGKTATIRLRLSDMAPAALSDPFSGFAEMMQGRQREADEFYRAITPKRVSKDEALVMRQALAGMLWSKQYFGFDVDKWLGEHGVDPMRPGGKQMRNSEWFHMVNDHVISMPDKWEYPWYAAWDLAFHTLALSTVDADFAKEQLDLMLQEFFLHPTGAVETALEAKRDASDLGSRSEVLRQALPNQRMKEASRVTRDGFPGFRCRVSGVGYGVARVE